MDDFTIAETIIKEFKGDSYLHGLGVLPKVGEVAASLGRRAVLIADRYPGSDRFVNQIHDSRKEGGVSLLGETNGAAPNCPREDLFRIADLLKELNPDVLVTFGGGHRLPV